MKDWRSAVYFHDVIPEGVSREEWIFLRRQIIRRDNFKCRRCDKRFKVVELTAHHLIPRDEGGSNDPSNLVALCSPCHDYVEINDLKTIAEIIGSYESDKAPMIAKAIETTAHKIDWRTWVYGGGRNPRL